MFLAACAAVRLAGQAPPRTWGRISDLAPGVFLVARRDLPDPNFLNTVVLLTQFGRGGAAGLVINRRSRIQVSRLYPGFEGRLRDDPVYWGGPVAMETVSALVRQPGKAEPLTPVFEDVQLMAANGMSREWLASRESGAVRVFAGYSGWSPGQLQREVEQQTWHILPGSPALVFDESPGTVWRRLIGRTESSVA